MNLYMSRTTQTNDAVSKTQQSKIEVSNGRQKMMKKKIKCAKFKRM